MHFLHALQRLFFVALTWGLVFGSVALADQAVEKDAGKGVNLTQQELDAKVTKLIEQLGSAQFATREKAQAELKRLGLTAFDALHTAQTNTDIEIALRARYLIRILRIDWSRTGDSPEVKRILRNYGDQNNDQRKNRMERLASLENHEGLPALCRMVRFETSDNLSKFAALRIMNLPEPPQLVKRKITSQTIIASVGLSKRPAALWLKNFSLTLNDGEASLPEWERLVTAEYDLFDQNPERTDPVIVRDLLRWQVALLQRLNHDREALEATRRTVSLIEENRQQILDAVDWLIKQKSFVVVDDVAKRFNELFEADAQLLYRLAESQVTRGDRARGEETAARALKINPTQAPRHIEIATSLRERGMFDWSESEHRFVMEKEPADSIFHLFARFLLSEMLHDNEKDLPAAKALQGVVNAMDKDPKVVDMISSRFRRNPGGVRSRMHYFYAQHHLTQGDAKKQREQLEQAVKNDPTDADALIAMYRSPGTDDTWKKDTKQRIDAAVGNFRDQIKLRQQEVERAPNEPAKANANRLLATDYNQFAWLVGNTYGDIDEAIRFSHKSLELRPEAGGFLDTLGRCYYTKGDLENAVKYQAQAVELEPHTGLIRRQLKLFKIELAEKNNKDK